MRTEELNRLFRLKGYTLGSCESFTGGLFANEVCKVPGASHFYKGGLVTYQTEEKVRLLGIPYSFLDENGVCSIETAAQMAGRAKNLLVTDFCVSFTGNAGPNPMEGKEVGEVYIGIAFKEQANAYRFKFSGDRETIQKLAVNTAIELLIQILASV